MVALPIFLIPKPSSYQQSSKHTTTLFSSCFSFTFLKLLSMERVVNKMVSGKPLVIFSKTSCCMSHTIKTLFYDFGANPTIYELDEISGGRDIEPVLSRFGCNPTVPAVFIGGEFVGGENEIMSLHLRGSLKRMLERAGGLWV